tara:strand:- start:838 stop:1611 length:774 start_codon:yes stop_codon:yes gene_type:complete
MMNIPHSKHQSPNTAFTLIELLAVIAVLAVLLGFLLPALSKALTSSKGINHLANLRALHTSLTLYTESNRSRYPFMGIPGHPELGVQELNDSDPGPGMPYNASFFAANSFHWPTLIARSGHDISQIADPDQDRLTDLRQRYPDPTILSTIYQLTHATVAAPEYWNTSTPPEPTNPVFSPQHTFQLKYPSAKGMLLTMNQGLYDDSLSEPVNWILVGLGDGSARKAENPTDPDLEQRPYGALPFPILSTQAGLHGRDF